MIHDPHPDNTGLSEVKDYFAIKRNHSSGRYR